jgi:hypothetical protein
VPRIHPRPSQANRHSPKPTPPYVQRRRNSIAGGNPPSFASRSWFSVNGAPSCGSGLKYFSEHCCNMTVTPATCLAKAAAPRTKKWGLGLATSPQPPPPGKPSWFCPKCRKSRLLQAWAPMPATPSLNTCHPKEKAARIIQIQNPAELRLA